MHLNFFDLQLFLNVIDTGSLTQGAARSSISLQAASERVKKLEQRYATQLLTRHASGIKLTAAGQTFAEYAQQFITQHKQLQQAMLPYSTGLHSEMVLWCNSSAQSEYLPSLLPHYLVENPYLQIDLKEAESLDIIQALKKGHAKLGLISSFFNADSLQTIAFTEDPLVLISPKDHVLNQYEKLNLIDLLSFPFVGLMQHHSLQQSIETQAKNLDCAIQYRLRLPNFAAITQVVANGVGIAIIPKHAAIRFSSVYAFHQIELMGDWANRKLLLAAQNFEALPMPYQHFAQFLTSTKLK